MGACNLRDRDRKTERERDRKTEAERKMYFTKKFMCFRWGRGLTFFWLATFLLAITKDKE